MREWIKGAAFAAGIALGGNALGAEQRVEPSKIDVGQQKKGGEGEEKGKNTEKETATVDEVRFDLIKASDKIWNYLAKITNRPNDKKGDQGGDIAELNRIAGKIDEYKKVDHTWSPERLGKARVDIKKLLKQAEEISNK
jgi:hypothetical protein